MVQPIQGRDPSLPPTVPETLHTPRGLVRDEFYAMGTTISLLLPEAQVQSASEAVRQLFATWEQTLSRFRADSELAQLNQRCEQTVIVSPLLFHVVQTALAAARDTRGLYDPTLLTQLVQAGYDRTFSQLPATQAASAQRPLPGGGWQAIQVNPQLRSVILPAGCGLDFGGIAKGMAVDAALVALQQLSITTALVNAGGDLAVLGLAGDYSSWPIVIEGPTTSWTVPLQRGALATSSTSRRHWQQGTHHQHHLLDPRTGASIQHPLWSVTVVASRCMQAEVATKAAFVLGLVQGTTFLTQHALAGLLVQDDGTWTTAGDWPAQSMQPP